MTSLSPRDIEARYRFAREIARAAADLAFSFYQRRQSLAIDFKQGLQDVVSEADRRVEALIRRMISRRFPLDGFLGEESGSAGENAACIWVVDPIDGTACFLNGLHTWCIAIGVVIDGEPTIGVVYDPNHREMFRACRGGGAFLNGEPIAVHAGRSVADGVMGVGISPRASAAEFSGFLCRLLQAGGMFVRSGSGALMTAQVAAGRLLGYYEPHMNAWDSLPGWVLTREAGGVANDFMHNDGLRRGNPLLLANAALYPQLAELIHMPGLIGSTCPIARVMAG
ncbi:inositol monophosphatase family protein [Serratia marcescens]|uniref:inositol monophosphatase family protein n=1 Tax=Serratia TaxID=613 RepID=UPI000667409E|nr:inositol monophosphatase family protein [Serratia marcescens]AVE48411.1 inositol monophosphatase [Serratia marcescens]MBH2971751.1 inositol monophosphatase [Serratia marcescens]MBH2977858.1 inositol monophosphatase [Serratia marcescens]MBN3984346.1 inositol monophosphatase [Serratia marcescens]MBN5324565.1 inositol monophosphatase [Serratia marcescens]